MKRINYLSWNDFFMATAKLAAMRSKDPSTQVGACIVNSKNRIISLGYNGMPNGCSDDEMPWEREGTTCDTKYAYVVHSETNAIMNCLDFKELNGSVIYCTLFPCNECAKLIVQSGIKKIYYLDDKYHDNEYYMCGRKLLDVAGVSYEKFVPEVLEIKLDLKE